MTQSGTPRADLAVKMTAGAPKAGATTTVTLTVTNTGPSAATKVRAAALIPRGWTVVNAGGGTLVGRQVLTTNTPSIASGATYTWTLTVRAGTTVGYTALGGLALSGTQDPKLANNVAAVITKVG